MSNVKVRLMEGLDISWGGKLIGGGYNIMKEQAYQKDNQINNYSREWRQGYQVMALAIVQVGDFTSMMTKGEWSKKFKRGN